MQVEVSNFDSLDEATNQPAAYIAAPVFKKNLIIGVVLLQLNQEQFNKVVNDYTGLGKSGETIVGSVVGSQIVFISPTRHDPNAAFRRSVKVDKEKVHPLYRRDGSIIWVQENTRAVRDTSGKLLYYEGIVQDISDRKRREDGVIDHGAIMCDSCVSPVEETRKELAHIATSVEELRATNQTEHERLTRETRGAIAQLSTDGQFLDYVREIIRFF
jgi:PAS domain S-box-containing protein